VKCAEKGVVLRTHEKQSEADTSKNVERYDLTLNCKEECDKLVPRSLCE